jgi:NTE family protein
MAMLPHSIFDGTRALRQLGNLLPEWPTERLWITAVRTRDGRRAIFGSDVHASVGAAVAASCAIPGIFRPVRIKGNHYIDGGAHSPTNADVLVAAGVDLALVLSPMSGSAGARSRSPGHLLRAMSSRRLQAECDTLQRAGIPTHVLEPDAETVRLMGLNPLDRARVPSIVTASFLHAGEQVAREQSLLEALYRPRRSRTVPPMAAPVRQAS